MLLYHVIYSCAYHNLQYTFEVCMISLRWWQNVALPCDLFLCISQFTVHIRSMHDQSDDPDVTDETDEHSEMTKRTSTKSSTPLDGRYKYAHSNINI